MSRYFGLAAVLGALVLGFWHVRADAPDALMVGFAEADITPQLGDKPVYMAGFRQNRKATKVHDPLMARAVVLKHGQQKVALVALDVVGFFHHHVVGIREQLPGFGYILVNSTHNHEGPDTLGLWGPNPFTSGVNPDYIKTIQQQVIKAVQIGRASCRERVEMSVVAVV